MAHCSLDVVRLLIYACNETIRVLFSAISLLVGGSVTEAVASAMLMTLLSSTKQVLLLSNTLSNSRHLLAMMIAFKKCFRSYS